MRKGSLWLIFALAVGAVAQAQDIDIPYQKFVLENGLTLIVHEDHKAPIVAVNLWYHVGSKNEKPGKTGFAHLFEHLMFGGSQHATGSYIKAMEKVGATDLNGTTNFDRTNFFENVPTSALDYALWMESDRMGFLDSEPEDAGPAARRGAEREAARRERALRPHRGVHSGEHLSRRAPLLLGRDRRDGGPGRRLLQGRAGMVQDLLRAVERGAGAGRRHRRQDGAREGGEVLWRAFRQDRR